MENLTTAALVERLDSFLRRTGMSERAFGIGAVGHHKVVRRLREGRATLATIERVITFMDRHERGERAEDAA